MNDNIKVLPVETSRLQLELSHKFLSNSTFESLQRSNFTTLPENQSEMIARRLKDHRHPLSGISSLLPELNPNHISDPDSYIKEIKSTHKLNSRILETWLNNTISDAASIDMPDQIVKHEARVPLVRYGIDRTTLLNSGLQSSDVDRIYRSLFVYSIGFFQLLRKILEHTKKKYTIITGIWKIYAILLEYCCQFDYEMIITTLNIEKKEEIDVLDKEYKEQIVKMEEHQRQMIENINLSRQQLQQVQKDLMEEIRKREELEDELLQRGSGHEEEVTMRLQFESKLNQMYAKLRDMESKFELMLENVDEMQKTAEERAEALQTERKKNLSLVQFKLEIEQEMKKTNERWKQIESINLNLEARLVECYAKIEELNTLLSNSITAYNETLNELAQKKIELDDVKFSLEICKGHINKLGTIIDEHKTEKDIHVSRIKYLENTLTQETNNNKHFQQEYVVIKEQDIVKTIDLEKYRTRCEQQEKELLILEQQRDSLQIHNDSLIVNINEYRDQLKSSQVAREQINALKVEEEKLKNNDTDMQASMASLNIKLHSIEKQFETSKGSLTDKISHLNEILESEKTSRQNWIHRYEEDQKTMANITTQLIMTQEKLNDSTIKNNNLTATIEENNLTILKFIEKNKQDLDENLDLRAENEDLIRKNRTMTILLERVDEDYKEKLEDAVRERVKIKEISSEERNCIMMQVEELWERARQNYSDYVTLTNEHVSVKAFLDTVNEVIDGIKEQLMIKTQEFEGKSMLLEEARDYIIHQKEMLWSDKNTIKALELDLKKAKKDLTDFRNLAPPDLRTAANPFRVLLKQIADVKGTLHNLENSKPLTDDFGMQWNAPVPRVADDYIQTDYVSIAGSKENLIQRRNSSSSSVIDDNFLDVPIPGGRKKNESLDLKNLKASDIKTKLFEATRKKTGGYNHEEELPTPLHMKSIYNNENTAADSIELSQQQSPGRFPSIIKKANPSSLVHLPQPIPAVGDIKRYLKQAVSRRKNDKFSSQ